MIRIRTLALTGLLASLAATAQAADAGTGRVKFADACAMCHSAQPSNEGGEIGPNLFGLAGRQAGTSDRTYAYSAALKRSRLVWDRAALDRFLTAPTRAAPGTTMDVTVTDSRARADIVAYLLSLKRPATRRR